MFSLHNISENAKWRGVQGVFRIWTIVGTHAGFLVVTLFDKRSVTDRNPVGSEDEYGSPDFAQVANVYGTVSPFHKFLDLLMIAIMMSVFLLNNDIQ